MTKSERIALGQVRLRPNAGAESMGTLAALTRGPTRRKLDKADGRQRNQQGRVARFFGGPQNADIGEDEEPVGGLPKRVGWTNRRPGAQRNVKSSVQRRPVGQPNGEVTVLCGLVHVDVVPDVSGARTRHALGGVRQAESIVASLCSYIGGRLADAENVPRSYSVL